MDRIIKASPYLEKSYALPFKISKEMLEDDSMYPDSPIYDYDRGRYMKEVDDGLCNNNYYCIDASTKLVIDAMVTNDEARELIIGLVFKFRDCGCGSLATLYLTYCSTKDAINKYLDSIGY